MDPKKENTDTMQTAQIEQIVVNVLESRLREAIEDFARENDPGLKEMALLERIVRVEEELKAQGERFDMGFQALAKNQEALLREMNARFEALQREMIARFEASDKRFEALQREMNARFDASDKRFEALQREMDARFEASDKRFDAVDKRFEAMDKRFTMVQWLIGIVIGIPSLAFAITQLINII